MKNLFVSLRHRQQKQGLPVFIHRIYTEEFNSNKPMKPIYSSDWLFYNPFRDGIPVPKEKQLPSKIIMVCKSVKKITFDFFSIEPREWIISDRFYHFINEHSLLENQYEVSNLEVVSSKNEKIGTKEYKLLRLYKTMDNFIDFKNSPNILRSKKIPGRQFPYYKDLSFLTDEIPDMFYLEEISFFLSFIVTEPIKSLMDKENFLGFDFYTLDEFVEERVFRDSQKIR